MQIELLAGLGLAFMIGVLCRRFAVPLPAPVRPLGALLVLALTSGFVVTQAYLAAAA